MFDLLAQQDVAERIAVVARKLRAKAHWAEDGYYTTETESAKNSAVREVCEELADFLDDAFDVDTRDWRATR